WRPDVVHAHNPGMAAVTALATRRPAIVSVHGVPEEDWAATTRVLRLSRLGVVACGPGVEAAPEGRVRAAIPDGHPPPPPPAPPPAQPEWPRPLLLSVGRLVEQKNHALAIRALAHVPDATLVIAGEGPLRGELEREAREAGVADRVVLAGLRPDARALMGAADAIVLPPRRQRLPLPPPLP